MSHAHKQDTVSEETPTDRSTRKLALVAIINFVGFIAEFAGGPLFGSIAFISDVLHILFNMLLYVMTFSASILPNALRGL